jgi:hypothetical protein
MTDDDRNLRLDEQKPTMHGWPWLILIGAWVLMIALIVWSHGR